MKNTNYTGFDMSGLGLAISNPARAQDWPQWRGANRDGRVEGAKLPKACPKSLTKSGRLRLVPASNPGSRKQDKSMFFQARRR